MNPLRQAFDDAPHLSWKLTNYFPVYEQLLKPYRDLELPVIVEFGVLSGGSLHMWRNYFGSKARVIGVDLNPGAQRHREEGFEIFLADQENLDEVARVFQEIGPVDIVIDDGAHTNPACVNTIWAAMPHIKPGGIHIVEDLHTSFDWTFGNPSETSSFAMGMALAENFSRAYPEQNVDPDVTSALNPFRERVRSVEFFSSLMVLHYRGADDPWVEPASVTNERPIIEEVGDVRNSRIVEKGTGRALAGIAARTHGRLPKQLRGVEDRARSLFIARSAKQRNAQMQDQLKRVSKWWR